MKLKQFIFAFTAMLSCFAVSVNAQVAKIGGTEYATIDEAIAAAQNGETIILNADVELTAQVVIPEGKVLTLDLNGKTVNSVFNGSSTTNHIYALSNKGTLTIKGNGSINSRGIYNYGSLTLNAGAINAIDGNGGYAVNNQSGSTFVMNGGVVAATNEDDHQSSSGGYDATALKVPAGCTATLNGGTINNVCDFTYAIDAAGTLNIPATSTITVNGTHGAIYVSGGVTTIDAGTFQIPADNYTRTDNVLYVSGGSLVINGGTFIGDSDTESGGACLWDAAGNAVVNGGTFKGSSGGDVWGTTGTTIKGGTFENLTEKQHIADGYEMNENGEVVEAVKEVKVATLAELQAALADNSNELPIIITETIVIPEGETVVLDLNGKTVTRQDEANQYALRNLGDLTIKDTKGNGSINARGIYNGYGNGAANVATAKIIVLSGTINAKGTNGGAAIFNYGVADIQGGNFTSIGGYSLNNQTGASMTIADGVTANNGIYASGTTLVVNGGEINGNRSGCHVLYAWNSAVTINGGTFYNYNSGNSTIMSAGTSEVTINGGTISIKDGRVPGNGNTWTSCLTDAANTAKIIVNGGTFNGGVRVQGGATMTINGGSFNDVTGSGYNVYTGAIVEVKGGTFTDAAAKTFATNNLAAGYELGKDGTVKEVTPVAVIGTQKFASLQAALDAAAAGTGNVTVTILADVDLTGVDWNPVTVSAPGYPVVTVEGNGKTITGLNDMLFAGTWAGKSGLTIKNITIENSAIVNDKDDAAGNVGVGAFIGYPQASATITLENCHLKNSSVEGGHWTGGLIGMAGGYNGADGPVFMNLTIKGCSVTGSTITGKGSVGGVIGHGSCAAWTNVVIEETTVYDNTITSTGSSNVKAGAVMGTIGAAGQPTTVNGVTNTGGMSVSATVAANTVKSNGTKITTIYGRQGTETGMLYVAGGSYDNYPIEKGVAYAAPAKGYKIVENNGTYGIVEDPEYGKVAKVGDACFETLAQAVAAVEDGGTITLIANETFTENNRYNNGGWWDGLGYCGDKSFTIDLAGFTISQDGALNDYLMWFKNDGAKANTITLKNGTLDAGTTAYCALATASSNAKKITVNLENIQLINNNSSGATLKIRGGAELNANAGTIITGKNSYLGIEAAGKTTVVNIYEGAEIYQNGTSSYCGCLAGASGNSTINVYGGYGKGVSGGFIAMTSGGTINVEGGEWIANTDGTYANGNKSVLVAQSEKGAKSIVNVTGGTFKGGYNCYGAAVGDAQINIKGGNFNAEPTSYVAEGYLVVENNGVWTVERGLAGAGTEAEPYLINNVSDLKFFRDEVNKGVANKYNDPGVWVALGADIDLSGENWVGIGSATADHGFMGNFDGKGYKIQNLTITDPDVDADGYAYAGLFGVTEGTDQDNQNTIKNLTIENVTITTTGHIAAAAVAYPYYTIIDNVKVCGDIKIQGGDYTAGVLAYTRRCVNASNLSIVGKEGSYVKGNITVGGVISDIQMNGGLTADYKNFSAEGLTISGEKSVGGISGIICKQTLDGATVKNVTLVCNNASVGIVSGSWGDVSTISNVIYENVTGATAIVGATWKEGNAVEAKIGNTYYATLDAAYKAAQEGATVELLAPVVIASGETLTLDKNVTVVYTSNVAGEDMFTNRGTLNISAGTITYANTDATASNVTVSTISTEPGSVLNITGGTVENKTVKADGSSIYSFAIDMLTNGNLGDVTATISGGKVYSDYMAIRQFNNGTACKNSLTISNGYIYGAKRAVQIHMDNNAAVTAISGGKIEAGKDGYALCNFAKTSALSVTDGEFIGAVYSASEKFISGGIYNNPVEAAYCKEGYMPNVIADGKYGVTAVANLVASFNGLGYATLAEAIAASTPETGWGGEVTLLKDVTLEGGYADAGEGLRIEKSVTINGAGYTIDCGKFTKGIRIYQNGDLASNVMFKDVNIVNNNNQGRCIDTRSAKINLMLNGGVNLTAHGTNSQPLTIGGSEAMTKVTISGGTIDAGTSGYAVISFVPVTNHINVQGNAVIKGLAAFYLKEGVTNTAIKLSQSTSIGTNKYASASGVFGAVVIEGSNNAVRLEHSGAVVKAVAADGAEMAAQAAFLVRGEGNTINILAENAQVITEGKNAYRAIVNTDVAASAKMIEKGNELKLVAENKGYQFYSFEEAVRFAGNEGTIKVVNDFELAEVWTVAEGQNITLDLNGKTLSTAYVAGSTTNHLYAIHNYGELTITDSSDAKTGKISARGIFNYGNMTLTSGTINAIDGNGGYGVRNYAGATFTMNGGTIATTYEDGDVPGEGYDASPVRVDEGATFTMNDGVINNVSNYTVAIDNYGTTIINGGKATTIHTTLANSGTMIIEGGEFTCNGLEGITAHALWAADGTTTINGGTFNGKDNYNGFNVDASEGAVVTITGGTFLPVHSGSLYGDGTITVSGGTFFDKISDQRCELGFQAVVNTEGTYDVKRTGKREAYTIVDGQMTEFVNENEIEVGTLTYTRGKIKGTWTPFYVPFAVPVSALADKFDVAYINDVRRTDSDNDGELDKFSMEVILIHCESKNVNGSSKTLKANYPYFIRSKSGQEVTMEIALTDAKLYAAKENVFDCTTMTEKFEIKGNYNQIPSDKFGENDYVVGGGVWGNITPGYPLNPFRFYMTRSSRDGSDPTTMAPMKSMKIVVCGEEDENGATIIYDIVEDNLNNNGNDYIYDLQGRRVSEPKKGGIYIKNGKKILF